MDRSSDSKHTHSRAGVATGAETSGRREASSPTSGRGLSGTFAAKNKVPLTPRIIELVQKSWAKVRPISDAAATLFYDRLFQLDPTVRPLFKSDIGEQKKKLMQTLNVAVDGLRDLEKLIPVLEDLGVRHAGYMVQAHHYDLVGQSLLWTLQEGLGDDFTPEVKAAWVAVYDVIAGVMKRAAAAFIDSGEHPTTLMGLSAEFRQAAQPRPAALRRSAGEPQFKQVSGRGSGVVQARQPSLDSSPHPRVVRRSSLTSRSMATPPPPPQAGVRAGRGGVDDSAIQLVQRSWAKVRPISDAAATLFYDRLFQLDPSVRALFKDDMGEQKKKLMQTLNVAVDGLRDLDRLVPVLEDLGVRHAGYMVQDEHYDRVGEALLWTLREGLGDEFTGEVKAAWTAVYDLIAGVMKRAAAVYSAGSGRHVRGTLHAHPPAPIPVAPARSGPARASGPVARPSSGPLDRRTIELVQASWAQVRPISDAAAALFYERLFELDPSVRALFKNDMGEQKRKLMQTLNVAVDGLRNPDGLIPILEDLGARHAGYMVQDRHYDLVGQALLWTLAEGLGDEFTSEIKAAWTAVYGIIADVMKRGARGGDRATTDRDIGSPALARRSEPRLAPPPASPPPASSDRGDDTSPSGPVSEREIRLVQSSWAKVRPISDAAATLFYQRLFELDPSVRQLFKNDMNEQKKKLMQTLNVAVDGLRSLDKLVPVLEDLGVRHAGYMVEERHYELVGASLLWTLTEGLGDDFTEEIKAAWVNVYGLVAGVMKDAAAGRRQGQPARVAAAPAMADPAPQGRAPQTGFSAPRPSAPSSAVAGDPAASPVLSAAPGHGAPGEGGIRFELPRGLALPLTADGGALAVHVTLEHRPPSQPEPARVARGGLGMAILLAVICGAVVMTVSSILLFSVTDWAVMAANVPALVLYVPPAGATLLTFVAFLMGYSWSRRTWSAAPPSEDT